MPPCSPAANRPSTASTTTARELCPSDLPTLATLLASELDTAAIVGSRVLDRRFGLARGFAHYDDRMLAERTGEYGYAERAAPEVVDRALHWLAARRGGRRGKGAASFSGCTSTTRTFPTWPRPPAAPARRSAKERYRAEVALVDREVGRLLAGLGAAAEQTLVAVAGDHGEALGEHGEETHGVLLYRGVLEVPLFVAGPGVPRGKVVPGAVAAWRLAPTVLALLGRKGALACGSPLPGLPSVAAGERERARRPQRDLPAPDRLRLEPARRLDQGTPAPRAGAPRRALRPGARSRRADTTGSPTSAGSPMPSPASSPATSARWWCASRHPSPPTPGSPPSSPSSAISRAPAAGPATELLWASIPRTASCCCASSTPRRRPWIAAISLPRGSPSNSWCAAARATSPSLPSSAARGCWRGKPESAIAAFREAARANPGLDFPHLNLADALREVGRPAEAEAEYRAALALDPRSLRGTLGLSQLLADGGRAPAAEAALRQALADGLESVAVRAALARLALSAGRLAEAEGEADRLLESAPEEAAGWLLKGEIAERRGDASEAMRRYGRAARLAPAAPEPFLAAGRLLAARGELADARLQFQRAIAVGRGTPAGKEAARRLAALPP